MSKILIQKKIQRKRGRPLKMKAPGVFSPKEQIIETALKLFYQFGINSVGVDRIISDSKISKMTFFKYFPTKRDLVLEFLTVRDKRYMNWFESTLNSITSEPKRKLEAALQVVEVWFKDSTFRGCAFINTSVEVGPGQSEEKIICVSHKQRLIEFLESLATEAGYKQCKTLAIQLVTIIDGATVRAQMDGPEAGIAALREAVKPILKNHKS